MHQTPAWLEIKAFDDETRILEGIATTPRADRVGDIIEPTGAQFTLPLPLVWQHDQKQPIGAVIEADVSPAGIRIKARIASVAEPGTLKDRLDEAYQSLRAKLVRGLSIGWTPVDVEPIPKSFGIRAKKWQWAELSAVTIPQNLDATIHAVKAAVVKESSMAATQTYSEQIASYEATRATRLDRQNELMTAATATNTTLDAPEAGEYDGISEEIKSIDAHLGRLRALEQANQQKATPIVPTNDPVSARARRGGGPIVRVKSNLPPGTGFVRMCQALAVTKGSRLEAIEYAKRWTDSTPEVELALKAAVTAGTTTDATWAGPLAPLKPLQDEFLEYLRPQTSRGKIPNLHRVPFTISIPQQTGGGTYGWVGQGAPKPVGKLTFGTVTLAITKCAGIIVITEELARNSTPSAEAVIRADMVNGIAYFLDLEFTDPAKAPVANVSPGSITNGVTPITTAGTTPSNARTDIQALINAMTTAGISAATAVLLMSETNASALGQALNPLGQDLFPGLSVSGGTALGIRVIPSQAVGNNVILLSPPNILVADDGGVTIDVSREASLQMDSAPTNPPDATTVFTSLWQSNLVGLRAERFINWKRARTGSVQYTVATYTV